MNALNIILQKTEKKRKRNQGEKKTRILGNKNLKLN